MLACKVPGDDPLQVMDTYRRLRSRFAAPYCLFLSLYVGLRSPERTVHPPLDGRPQVSSVALFFQPFFEEVTFKKDFFLRVFVFHGALYPYFFPWLAIALTLPPLQIFGGMSFKKNATVLLRKF